MEVTTFVLACFVATEALLLAAGGCWLWCLRWEYRALEDDYNEMAGDVQEMAFELEQLAAEGRLLKSELERIRRNGI